MSFLISIYLGPNLITEIDAAKQSKISIGRSASNTVVIQNSVVSGSHAEISLIDKQLYIKDLGSTNGTFVDHVKIPQGQLVLVGQKSISLSGVVTIQVRPSEKASTASSSQASVPNLSAQIQQVLQQKGSVIIGRADSADVKIENSQVSRQHAKISSSEGRYFVEDLGSMN